MFRFAIYLLLIFEFFSPVKSCNWQTKNDELKTTSTEKSTTQSMQMMEKQRIHEMVHQFIDSNWTAEELIGSVSTSRSFFDFILSLFGFGNPSTTPAPTTTATTIASTTEITTTEVTTTETSATSSSNLGIKSSQSSSKIFTTRPVEIIGNYKLDFPKPL